MTRRVLLWLLDKHLLECNRSNVSSWKKDGRRQILAGCELLLFFFASYIAYLFLLNQAAIYFGKVPSGFSSTPLFEIGGYYGEAVKNHVVAACLAVLVPIHRMAYNLWIEWFRSGVVNCVEDAYPPLNKCYQEGVG